MAVVVITGASSGIGEATARLLASHGHQLVLAARRLDRLEALQKELSAVTQVLVVQTDVADPAQVVLLVQRAEEHFGRIDVWVNNAGVGPRSPWWEQDAADVQRVVNINLVAPMVAVQALLPGMKAQGRGHIINVASVAGHIGTNGPYSATKWGLRGLSESMRRELKPFGIKVSVVSPGFIATEMTRGNDMKMPGPEVVARVMLKLIERPRREVIVPGWYRPVAWLARTFPFLADWMMAGYYKA
jgi:short-subunit dehydrogenase